MAGDDEFGVSASTEKLEKAFKKYAEKIGTETFDEIKAVMMGAKKLAEASAPVGEPRSPHDPFGPKKLRKSIRRSARVSKRDGKIVARLYVSDKNAPIARWVNLGTAAHEYKRRGGRHPGSAANPFMFRAVERMWRGVTSRLKRRIR